jgi:hypothetical protein
MGDIHDDICSATPPTITGRYSIPYDVDFLWSEGCGGSDWWDDDAGTSVNLLVSDTGSAYVCPSGSEAFWRIYVDRWGQPWELGRWPRPSSDDYEASDASDEFADILECAETSDTAAVEAAQSFKICSVYYPNQAIHAMQLGLEVALPESFSIHGANDWKLTFVEGGIVLRNRTNSDFFSVDSVPIVSNIYEEPTDHDDASEWADDHNHGDIDLMETTDRASLIHIISALRSGAEDAIGLERAAMELAANAFDRACRTRIEIEAFEEACYE